MEYTKILIRYGELVLKGKNRKNFINVLKENIRKIVGTSPETTFDRMYLPYSKESMKKLQYVFGVNSYSPVIEIPTNIDAITKCALASISFEHKSFKIIAHRNWKEFQLNSQQIIQIVAEQILQHHNIKVSLHNPDLSIFIEIRKETSYVFFESIKGLDGLPTGISGKSLHLISGGIDSPVAALELMKRGVHVDFLSFITPPHTDEKTVEKVDNIVKILTKYQASAKLFQINYTDLMNYLGLASNPSYKITLMRRSFYRIASIIATKNNYLAISNGENLGQVASQTMQSIQVISSQSQLPIYRPLLTFNKNETIALARKFNTYEISIAKASETCELFAPKQPITSPTFTEVERLENELNLLSELEKKTLLEQKIIKKFSI